MVCFMEKLNIVHIISLRMAVTMLSLLLLVQLLAIPTSAFVVHSEVCKDQFAYANSNGLGLFYINEDSVENVVFCDALQTYYTNGCILEGDLGNRYCGSVLTLVDFPFKTARKFLQKKLRDESTIHHGKDNNIYESMSTTETVGIAAGGALLVCCVFLCPCFYKKRRETAHNVLAKDVNSSKSLTSQPYTGIITRLYKIARPKAPYHLNAFNEI